MRRALLAVAALLCASCAAPATCQPQSALDAINAAELRDLEAQCGQYGKDMLTKCPKVPAIRAEYEPARERWIECR